MQKQNGHFSLTEGSSGNWLRLEFKLSLLKQFLFPYNLVTCQCQCGKCTLWHKSPQQLISLCSLSCPWLPICDVTWTLDREVTWAGPLLWSHDDTSLLTPDLWPDPGYPPQPLHSILACYGINHSLESQTRVSLGHAKHSLESGVWGRNREWSWRWVGFWSCMRWVSGELPCMEESLIRTTITASYVIIAL